MNYGTAFQKTRNKMGIFRRLFSSSNEAKIERAKIFLEKGRFNDARLEIGEIQEPTATQIRNDALEALAEMNIEEARARYQSGDYQGANEHLKMAKGFGATEDALKGIRRNGTTLQQQRKKEARKKFEEKNAIRMVGEDPLWSLPPNHPHIRYALRVENYPVELRERLVKLGPEFVEIVLQIEDGNPKVAFDRLGVFVETDPIVRYERARAALKAGMVEAAISDLAFFGKEVGHQVIENQHTGALLGHLLSRIGRKEQALDNLNRQIETGSHPALEMVRSQLLESMGDWKAAAATTADLVQRSPRNMNLIRQLARIRLKQGQRVLATQILEQGLNQCCTPGQCGSQPLDVAAVRMLAQTYLEDRVKPERCKDLLAKIQRHVSEPIWDDQYLSLLWARNQSDPFVNSMAQKLYIKLGRDDPRRKIMEKSFELSA